MAALLYFIVLAFTLLLLGIPALCVALAFATPSGKVPACPRRSFVARSL
jgi:hypothetical protein